MSVLLLPFTLRHKTDAQIPKAYYELACFGIAKLDFVGKHCFE